MSTVRHWGRNALGGSGSTGDWYEDDGAGTFYNWFYNDPYGASPSPCPTTDPPVAGDYLQFHDQGGFPTGASAAIPTHWDAIDAPWGVFRSIAVLGAAITVDRYFNAPHIDGNIYDGPTTVIVLSPSQYAQIDSTLVNVGDMAAALAAYEAARNGGNAAAGDIRTGKYVKIANVTINGSLNPTGGGKGPPAQPPTW